MTTHNDPRAHELIEKITTHYPPQGDQAARYERITAASREYALTLADCCPGSAELTLALRALASSRMLANMSIAVNEPRTDTN